MPDFARSTDPAVQHQLDRLAALSPGGDILGLDRITRLLARLGDPHRALPPVFHVAGTNGKGSTCAFLRAALEAAGHRVHVYTSPHLVRFNERIRVAGTLIEDAALAELLGEVLDAGGDIGPSFFEATTAVAFLAFARTPADACVVEVGLGGRLDATNVIEAPVVTGIAQLGLDHQSFLGDAIEDIAVEKAGIAKRGVPLVTLNYRHAINALILEAARRAGAQVLREGLAWRWAVGKGAGGGDRLHVTTASGSLTAEPPTLAGEHQYANAALALAMLRAQTRVEVPIAAQRVAPARATWPARLQKLGPGPLRDLLPEGTEMRLDGGHNPAAAEAVAGFLRREARGAPVLLVLGLVENKDAKGLLSPLAGLINAVIAVPVPGHPHHAAAELARHADALGVRDTGTAPDVAAALRMLRGAYDPRGQPPLVLIMGSLYLAGEVLRDNQERPE